MLLNLDEIRKDFPILMRKVNDNPLVYLDNGASAQKPQVVLDAVMAGYGENYANVHRGLHHLSNISTQHYEDTRAIIARFLNAKSEEEIVFNSGATAGINMVAYSWAMPRMTKGDEIILSVMEHHANIVPWHFLRERLGVILKWVETDENGDLDIEALKNLITERTKLIAITHVSNVLGTIVNVKKICQFAKNLDIAVLVDGAQASVHMPVDVQDIGCDFYAITGHKLYGPNGSGAIYIKAERQAEMRPFLGGGDMIERVERDFISWNKAPMKFEAGTPAIVPTIGLGVALTYLMDLGMSNIEAYERDLCIYAHKRLKELDWLTVHGNSTSKAAIFSFSSKTIAHPHDISTILDKKGIAIRAGHHCAQPLMTHLGVNATVRASFGLYNTKNEVDALIDGLELCHALLY